MINGLIHFFRNISDFGKLNYDKDINTPKAEAKIERLEVVLADIEDEMRANGIDFDPLLTDVCYRHCEITEDIETEKDILADKLRERKDSRPSLRMLKAQLEIKLLEPNLQQLEDEMRANNIDLDPVFIEMHCQHYIISKEIKKGKDIIAEMSRLGMI